MSSPDVLTRTYTAIVHPRDAERRLERQVRTVSRGAAACVPLLTRAVAHRASSPEWIGAWRTAVGEDAPRLASLITASWVGVEVNPPLSACLPGGSHQAEEIVSANLRHLGLNENEVSRFVSDQVVTRSPVLTDGAVWVSYLPDDLSSGETVGWEKLDERLTGLPSRAPSGALSIPCANVMSRGMGQGDKTDPVAVARRAGALLEALEDTGLTTLGDLAGRLLPDPDPGLPTGKALELWLSQGLSGRAPAPVLLLRSGTSATSLDEAGREGGCSLRRALTTKTRQWSTTWNKRAAEVRAANDGALVAGTRIGQAVRAATSMPYSSGPYTDVLINAAQELASHRQRLHARSRQWARAASELGRAETAADNAVLAALDAAAADGGCEITPYGPVLSHQRRQELAVLVADLLSTRSHECTAPRPTGRGSARSWLDCWLIDHSCLWESDGGAGLGLALGVHAARAHLAGLGVPVFERPDPVSNPVTPTYSRGRWRGRVRPDGTVTMTVTDDDSRTGYTTIALGWSSRRITRALDLSLRKEPRTGGASPQADTTSLIEAESGTVETIPTTSLRAAAFTIAPENRGQRTSWRMRLLIGRPPSPATGPAGGENITVMGVALSTRKDATWTTWRTLPGVRASEGIDVLPKDPGGGVPRPARRISAAGCGLVEFAHPVHEGTIRLGDPQGDRATEVHDQAALGIRDALTGLLTPGPPRMGSRRTALVAWSTRTLRAALTAQRTLVDFISTTDQGRARTLLQTLDSQWPLSDDERASKPSSVWGRRRAAVNQAIAAKGRSLLPGGGQGLSLERAAELDEHLELMHAAATAPTPRSHRAVRRAPDGLGAAIAARRDRLRAAWARELASRIVTTALSQDAAVISLASPAESEGRLPAHAHKDVLRHVRSLAREHGIRVITVKAPSRTHPITDAPLPLVVAVVPVDQAIRIYRSDPTWRRLAAAAAVNPTAHPLTTRAQKVLASLDAEQRSAEDRRTWVLNTKNLTLHLPHPRGSHLAAAAVYERIGDDSASQSPSAALRETGGLRLPGLQDRDVVVASHAARKGIRLQMDAGRPYRDDSLLERF